MMTHRSDILMRSAQRLLDQVMVLSEEANTINLDGDDDDERSVVPKKKALAPPYGQTGEMFGLRGVREPNLDTPDKRITDLEQNEGDTFAMRVPKLDDAVKDLEEPTGLVQAKDIGSMYRQLGYADDVAGKAKEVRMRGAKRRSAALLAARSWF